MKQKQNVRDVVELDNLRINEIRLKNEIKKLKLDKEALKQQLILHGVVWRSEKFTLPNIYKLAQNFNEEKFIELVIYN